MIRADDIFIILTSPDLSILALTRESPVFDSAVQLSKGFMAFFTTDEYLQNVFGIIISPVFFMLLIIGAAYFLYKFASSYLQKSNNNIINGEQLLLFKAKKLGLSEYQFKILKGISEMLRLNKPSLLIDDSHLFESTILKFMAYASRMGESSESMEYIGKELIITYEKIYHPADIRKPIDSVSDLEVNTLLSVETAEKKIFICKLRTISKGRFIIHFFADKKDLEKITPGLDVKVFFWRSGDAEYSFNSIVISIQGSMIELQIPPELSRGTAVPYPLIDLVMPCTLMPKTSLTSGNEGLKPVEADIFKINESEAEVRCSLKLAFDDKYIIEFAISDFTVKTEAQVLRSKFIAELNVFYYNFKFIDISEAGKSVISNYIIEQLFSK